MTSFDLAPTALDDHRLVAHAASIIGVPRAEVRGDRASFVLHAPLELLARATLLPHVAPAARERARARIAALAASYDDSGPPRGAPPPRHFSSVAQAAAALRSAMGEGDVDAADGVAAWLGERARPDQLGALLSGALLPSLEAAGHANIYLALLGRTQPRGLPGQLLRHPVNALTSSGTSRMLAVPAATNTVPDRDGAALERLLDALWSLRPDPLPGLGSIASLVEHAQASGALDRVTDREAVFVAPERPAFELLRFGAQAMLQGPEEHAPYGWTHCLTLAQAPLLLAAAGADVGCATFVATAYLAAHWNGYGVGAVDPTHVPEPVTADLVEALDDGPAAAAAVAWHAEDRAEVAAVLATAASVGEDAHRVKYTLACLDAAACDPPAARLHLAAAAHLNAWWQTAGDRARTSSARTARVGASADV